MLVMKLLGPYPVVALTSQPIQRSSFIKVLDVDARDGMTSKSSTLSDDMMKKKDQLATKAKRAQVLSKKEIRSCGPEPKGGRGTGYYPTGIGQYTISTLLIYHL